MSLQELNSVEAIKTAVQCGLGAAFVSACAIQKELDLGLVSRVDIAGVRLARGVLLVSNPHRAQPHAISQASLTQLLSICWTAASKHEHQIC